MDLTLILRGIVRGVHVASSLSEFGAIFCFVTVIKPSMANMEQSIIKSVSDDITLLIRASLLVTILTGSLWLLSEAAYIAGGNSLLDGLPIILPVLFRTNFGRILVIRLLLLVFGAMIFGAGEGRIRSSFAMLFAGLSTILEADLGHGAAMGGIEGNTLFVSLMVYVLAAGAWLGGLVPLFLALKVNNQNFVFDLAHRFSVVGCLAVGALSATALIQWWYLIGTIQAFIETTYGRAALAKLALFICLMYIAVINRQKLAPRLSREDDGFARIFLRRNIIIETVIGIGIIVLASVMLNLAPALTMP